MNKVTLLEDVATEATALPPVPASAMGLSAAAAASDAPCSIVLQLARVAAGMIRGVEEGEGEGEEGPVGDDVYDIVGDALPRAPRKRSGVDVREVGWEGT